MTTTQIITTILTMVAGLAVFIFGLTTMSDKLENQAGGKLRRMFAKATSNKYKGLGVGAGVTAIIHSSSATTVMVVGLVNAGILSLYQATAIIMGANIGTTVTAVIISLPITEFIAASGIIGIFMAMASHNSKTKNLGYIIIGMSMLFAGLLMMSNAMEDISELQAIKNFFSSTNNPLLLVIIGFLVTGIIQSSSVATGILITIANVGLIGIDNSIYIILGVNIGTCVTALLASMGTNFNAQRAAVIHLLFNVMGMVIFFFLLLITPIKTGLINILSIFSKIMPSKGIGAQIAVFHIIFNVTTTLLLFPFINQLVSIATKIVPERKGVKKEHELQFLNELILESPAIAIEQAKNEIIRMADMAKTNLDISVTSVSDCTLTALDDFNKREKYIDWLNQEIPSFLTKISAFQVSYEDEKIIASYYHVVSDVERIGDYAENIMDYTEKLYSNNIKFSDMAKEEIHSMYLAIINLYNLTIKGFTNVDLSILNEVDIVEDSIDKYKLNLSAMHIKRLNDGICSAQSGALFLSLVSNLERIADHMRNIYYSIRKYAKSAKTVITTKLEIK